MRSLVLILSLFVATAASARSFSDADKADLDRVSTYLNSIHTMRGGFVQIDPDGTVDQGAFVLSKPGRVRFEYDPPAPTLIVSDGRRVVVANKALRTVDSYALSHTPLGLILDDDIDLKDNSDVTGVAHQPDALIVRARSSNFGVHADITLTFAEPSLELRQWTVVDNQGLSTTVALRETQTGVDIPASSFVLPDKKSLSAPQK
ncbi:MAG TPA: outer membrane lipoprotein carrier protein LolA [Rhizomicrobium sp.]|nr:outer membrane lipoprotein carrier protein LolA [Rhizomicrobium sp.]